MLGFLAYSFEAIEEECSAEYNSLSIMSSKYFDKDFTIPLTIQSWPDEPQVMLVEENEEEDEDDGPRFKEISLVKGSIV